MWIRLVWRDERHRTLLIPAALFFFGAGMLFSTGHQRRDGAVSVPRRHRWRAGRRAAKYWFRRTGVAFRQCCRKTVRGGLGLLMTLMGLLITACWLPLASHGYRIGDERFNVSLADVLPGVSLSGAIIALSRDSCAGRHAPSSPS